MKFIKILTIGKGPGAKGPGDITIFLEEMRNGKK